ncbi:MAG TPA: winged helix-turn-helix domain-containing protein [Methanothrix sp.]|nr:winged helix-turn-helix domain-containing protein [Methanothrix sp.]
MPSDNNIETRWWEGADGHRYALEVLQHPLRREMLRLIAGGMKEADQIAVRLDLPASRALYHLQMLQRALVIDQEEGGWKVSPTGELYLKHVEAKS